MKCFIWTSFRESNNLKKVTRQVTEASVSDLENHAALAQPAIASGNRHMAMEELGFIATCKGTWISRSFCKHKSCGLAANHEPPLDICQVSRQWQCLGVPAGCIKGMPYVQPLKWLTPAVMKKMPNGRGADPRYHFPGKKTIFWLHHNFFIWFPNQNYFSCQC